MFGKSCREGLAEVKARTTGTYALIALGAVMAVALCISRAAGVEAAYPFERAWRGLCGKVGSRIVGAWRGSAASAENVSLRREVAALALMREDVARLEAENERLRQALEYSRRSNGDWLAAEVLSDGGANPGPRRMIRVDKGSLAGVKRGDMVTVPDGLVGRVASVTPHTSEVMLISDPSLKVACEAALPGDGVLRGTLAGGTDEQLVMKHILSKAEVPPRSQVFTSGLGGVFPKGIAVGTLLEVRTDHDSPRREGEVLPAVDFSTLKDVFIRRER